MPSSKKSFRVRVFFNDVETKFDGKCATLDEALTVQKLVDRILYEPATDMSYGSTVILPPKDGGKTHYFKADQSVTDDERVDILSMNRNTIESILLDVDRMEEEYEYMLSYPVKDPLFYLKEYGKGFVLVCTDNDVNASLPSYLPIGQSSTGEDVIAFWNTRLNGWVVKKRDEEVAEAYVRHQNREFSVDYVVEQVSETPVSPTVKGHRYFTRSKAKRT